MTPAIHLIGNSVTILQVVRDKRGNLPTAEMAQLPLLIVSDRLEAEGKVIRRIEDARRVVAYNGSWSGPVMW